MKKYIKLYFAQILMILIVLFDLFILKSKSLTPWQTMFFWIGLLIVCVVTFGRRNRVSSKYVDVMQMVFIYCMGYELITYLSGLILGFVRSPYSMEIRTMIKNITPYLVMIIAQEFIRFSVINRYSNNKKVIISITLSFILYEIGINIGVYDLSEATDLLKMFTMLVGGSITKNCLCSYLAYRADYKPVIIYRSIFELIIYVVPIFPNLGDYIEAMVSMLFPILLLVSIIALFEKKKYREPKKSVFELLILWIPTVAVILVIVALQTGIFKYRTMSIGSQSMYPNINKGDVVVIEQFSTDEELRSITVGEVLVFKHNDIIIVHRVTKVTERNGRLIFNTKGDNNNSVDAYDIDQSEVVGIAKFKIPFIGQPSVWLSEVING